MKQWARRVVPTDVKALRNFLTAERKSTLPFSDPALMLSGFHSNRPFVYPERPSTAKGYISDLDFLRRIDGLNPAQVRRELSDKLGFAERMQAEGFGDRMPRMFGVSRDGRFEVTEEYSGEPIIIKPVDGRAGQGISAFTSLDDALAACPPDRTFLVQERVQAHAYGREIFPGSLNALRVQVVRRTPGAGPVVAAVVQRMGSRATAPAHSLTAGGLVARVTPDGVLTYAIGPTRGRHRERFDTHYETGGQITGRVVPFYAEALDLARELMTLYPDALYVGWDIAIAERGPIVLEGNATWPNLATLQAHGPFANAPEVRDFFVERGLLRVG